MSDLYREFREAEEKIARLEAALAAKDAEVERLTKERDGNITARYHSQAEAYEAGFQNGEQSAHMAHDTEVAAAVAAWKEQAKEAAKGEALSSHPRECPCLVCETVWAIFDALDALPADRSALDQMLAEAKQPIEWAYAALAGDAIYGAATEHPLVLKIRRVIAAARRKGAEEALRHLGAFITSRSTLEAWVKGRLAALGYTP